MVVQTAAEAAVDPQVVDNDLLQEVDGTAVRYRLVASPAQFDGEATTLVRAPGHGEHTDEILLELGHDMDHILKLKETGAAL